MLVGDVIKGLRPSYGVAILSNHEPPPVDAHVVYIHPERRFYTVRFDYRKGSLFESFFMEDRGNGQK